MKTFSPLSLITALSLLIAGPAFAESTQGGTTGLKTIHTIKVLPEEISRSLKITWTPTSQPVPFLIGNYWHCTDTPIGTELCHPTLVVCTDDQSTCVEL